MFVVLVEVLAFSYSSAKNLKKKTKAFEKLRLTVTGEACEPLLGVGFLLRARLWVLKEFKTLQDL